MERDNMDVRLVALILAAVMVIGGLGAYFIVGMIPVGTKTNTSETPEYSCCPNGNPNCCFIRPHDVTVFAPTSNVQAGSSVEFTATIPSGVIASTTYNFGDNTLLTTTSRSATVSHAYSSPGEYYVYAAVTDTDGVVHDNLYALPALSVQPSPTLIMNGIAATVNMSVTSGSTSTMPGGAVGFVGNVLSAPSQTGWNITRVSFVSYSPNAISFNQSTFTPSTTTAAATAMVAANATDGVYAVAFVTESSYGILDQYSNYTFSIAVGGEVVKHAVPPPILPGTFTSYLLAPGGSFSEDPATDYEALGAEPLLNVYQTLVSYNGSLAGPYPNDFVPNLATCVPGSDICDSLYGTAAGGLLHDGGNWTFVISHNARFYDPTGSTPRNWTVEPNDVLFSFARTCLFSTWPSYETNPGWIECQSLLPYNANGNGDTYSGVQLHAPLLNTPTNIFNAIRINDSAYCTATMMDGVHGNGCVTFVTGGSGQSWPFFLELIADPMGASVMPCSWGSALQPLPGLLCTESTDPTGINDRAWDSYEEALSPAASSDYVGTSSNPVPQWISTMRWNMVGSGPYYLSPKGTLQVGVNYQLTVNPAWTGPFHCEWRGCLPVTFPVKTVDEIWETTAEEGETAFEHGDADLVTIPATDWSSVLIPMVRAGTATVTSAPGLSIFFTNFDMSFSQSGAQGLLPSGYKLNAPSDLFQDLAFRQFLIHAYPYQTVQAQYNTVDGIPNAVLYGGAIPIGMGNYYPTNVSWDTLDPSSTGSNSAGGWWSAVQAETGSSAIAKAACTTSNPCVFPFPSFWDRSAEQNAIDSAWIAEVSRYSNGAVDVVQSSSTCWQGIIIDNGCSGEPGQNPMPIYDGLGWAPDYPDPTDFTDPLYMPDSTYTYGDAVQESFDGSLGAVNLGEYVAQCPSSYVWAVDAVTTACQGTAYDYLVTLLEQAAHDVNLNERVLLYNEVEHIAQQLGLYVPSPGQSVMSWVAASWINGATLNTNPMIGGAGDSTWYTVQYAQGLSTPSGPSVSSFSASPSIVYVGSWTNITVGVTGVAGPLTYVYAGLPPGCSSANLSVIPCRPTSEGSYKLTVKVTNPAGVSVMGDMTLTVQVRVAVSPVGAATSATNSPVFSVLLGVMIVAIALDAVVLLAEWMNRGDEVKLKPPPVADEATADAESTKDSSPEEKGAEPPKEET
jgi:hypothetical protein